MTSPLDLYRLILAGRLSEETITDVSRAGELPGHHSGLGHEAVGVGVGLSVGFDDCVQTSYRSGAAVMHARGLSLHDLVFQGFGLLPGPRAQHPGGPRILRSTGILGGQVPTAVGVAMSYRLRRSSNVVVSVIGDGASNEGAVHECMNIAGVKRLPIIFVVENNGIALSTRAADTTAASRLADRGAGYGIPVSVVDGGDVVAAQEAMTEAVARTREEGTPQLVEMLVSRPAEHATGIPDVRSQAEVAEALAIDCVERLRHDLIDAGAWDEASDAALRAHLAGVVASAVEEARQRRAAASRPVDTGQLPEEEAWRMAHAEPLVASLVGVER
jgi:TPP-dependent pyruvate/acetoin dehydrogenase alpha subunit